MQCSSVLKSLGALQIRQTVMFSQIVATWSVLEILLILKACLSHCSAGKLLIRFKFLCSIHLVSTHTNECFLKNLQASKLLFN